jgi:hypothetical protein
MSKAAAKSALSNGLQSAIQGMARGSADDIAEILLRNSDSLAESTIRNLNPSQLVDGVRAAYGSITPSTMADIARNADEVGTIAKQGVDELPTLAAKVTSEQSKQLIDGAETLAKKGELGSKNVDEGNELMENATKNEGGRLEWFKKNPKLSILGFTVVAISLYVFIQYAANGKSPADALDDLLSLPGKIAAEMAALLAGLVASFVKGLAKIFGPLIMIALAIGGVFLVFVIIRAILKSRKKRSDESMNRLSIKLEK